MPEVKVNGKSLALKVERALKMMSEDFQGDDDDEGEDQEMAFITNAMKKFWKKNQSRRSSDSPNLANIRYFNCQEMGHFSNTYPKAKGESSYSKE